MKQYNKRMYIALFTTIGYYIIFILCMCTLFKKIQVPYYEISENCIIIHGRTGATAPPVTLVEGATSIEGSASAFSSEEISSFFIEITGKSIFNYKNYTICDWIAYGEVTGVTYARDDDIYLAVFECTKLYPLLTMYQLFSPSIIIVMNLPFGLLVSIVIYIFPGIAGYRYMKHLF